MHAARRPYSNVDKSRFTRGSQVASPTHVSKSQHGGKVATCEPQVITKIWLNIIEVISIDYFMHNCLRDVG